MHALLQNREIAAYGGDVKEPGREFEVRHECGAAALRLRLRHGHILRQRTGAIEEVER